MSRLKRREVEKLARDFLAVVATIMAVVLMAVLFRYEPDLKNSKLPKRRPAATALALNTRLTVDDQTRDWESDLMGSLIDQDPTLTIHPTDIDPLLRDIPNYSDIRKTEFVRPHRPIDYTQAVVFRLPVGAVTQPELAAMGPEPMIDMIAARRNRAPELRHVPRPAKTPAPVVHVVGLDGVELTDAPPIAPETVAALGPRQVNRPTIVQIQPRTFGARVKLIDSCGDPALDDLALAHYRQHARHLQALTVDPENEAVWLESDHVYQIVWHYLPTVDRPQLPVPAPSVSPTPEATAPPAESKSP